MQFSLKKFPQVPRVKKPNERHEESSKKEHDGLLFNDTIILFVDVIVCETLDQNSHHGSCEEKAQNVLKHEMELS